MKRKLVEEEQQLTATNTTSSNNKKMKQQQQFLFLPPLSEDEQGVIFSFLHVGEMLMLSLTCKDMYRLIEDFAKVRTPYLLVGSNCKWNLSRALSAVYESLVINSRDHCLQLATYLNQNEEENQLPNHITIDAGDDIEFKYEDLYDLLFISKKTKSGTTTTSREEQEHQQMIDVVNIDWTCDRRQQRDIIQRINPDYNHIFEITREMVIPRVGFSIKHLRILVNVPMIDLYGLLSCCYSLESLVIYTDYSVNSLPSQWSQGKNDSIDTGCTKVPLLSNLNKLVIDNNDHESDYETVLPLIINLLQLAPNLEEFEYMYVFPLGDQLLNYLALRCPKLKKLYIEASECDMPLDGVMTDNGIYHFLKMVPSITHLIILNNGGLSGEIYTRMGHFPNLKVLHLDRYDGPGGFENEYEDVRFGGGIMSSLEVLVMDGSYSQLNVENLSQSIIKTCPNLKRIHSLISDQYPFDMEAIISGCTQLIDIDMRNPNASTISKLLNKDNLQVLDLTRYCPSTKDLQSSRWNSLRSLTLDKIPSDPVDEWTRALLQACPNLEKVNFNGMEFLKRAHDPFQTTTTTTTMRSFLEEIVKGLMAVKKETENMEYTFEYYLNRYYTNPLHPYKAETEYGSTSPTSFFEGWLNRYPMRLDQQKTRHKFSHVIQPLSSGFILSGTLQVQCY